VLLLGALALQSANAFAGIDVASLTAFENKPVTRVALSGHKVTKDYVITRELETRAGEPFKVETLLADVQRLENISIFAEVGVAAEAEGPGVAVTFQFKEMPSLTPFVGFAYTDENGFSVGPGVSALNLTGRRMSLSARAYFGDAKQQWLRYSWPWIKGNHVSFDFYSARLTRPDKLNEFEETSYEFNPTLGRFFGRHGRLKGWLSFFRMESDVDGKTLSPDNQDLLARTGASVGWDDRDSWTLPRRGWRNELSLVRTMGDGDFWTLDVDLRRYLPVGRRGRVALSGLATLQSGTVGEDVPQYLTYYLGGSNSIRGYKPVELGPSLNGKNQMLGTAEYSWNVVPLRRFDIWKFAFRVGLELAAFTDLGIAWSASEDLRWDHGRGGAGAGIRLLVPGSGEMLRFDVGWSEQGGFVFHFASGTKAAAQRNRVR